MMKRIMVLVCIVAGLYQFIAIALHNTTPFWTVALFYVSFLLWLLMDKERGHTMDVHFYTDLENYQEIKLFGKGKVWNKSEAKKTDIHVSFDIEKYHISQYNTDNTCVFTVGSIEASTNW